jgi:nucleotide-binding universal stress UspA family protein
MALKDLLVHVNGSKHASHRVDFAVRLALDFDAHLAGVYTMPEFTVPAYLAAQLPADVLSAQRALLGEARDRAKASFEERARKAGIKWEWRDAEGDPAEMAALHARYADLALVGQNDPDEELPELELDVPERVVLDSGRPCLVIPYAGKFTSVGERVLVAWNATAQATRAVNDALPLIARARKVIILAINPGRGPAAHGDVPGADIALHLARHGVKAEAGQVFADDIDTGDMILSRAADEGVDMIVMGAYGHARLREMVLGGATRDLLGHMTVPVLMSH